MRATEFITETMSVPAGDPILNDPNLYLLLEHYLGKAFIKWAASESPYTPRNSFTQKIAVTAIKPYYNRVAAQLKPLAAGPEPDIDQILNIVFSIPGFVNQGNRDFILAKIKNQKAADEISGWVWKGTNTQTAQAGTTNEDWNKVNRREKTNDLRPTHNLQRSMRAKEFVREENYGEAANIDWEKFRAGMTALAMDQEELRGYQGVDAIVFLGLMGDPSPRSRPIDIRLQSPARIVVLNAAGVDLLGQSSGMYLDPNHNDLRDYPNRPDYDGRTQERKAIRKDYDIAVSHKNFDPAFDARTGDSLDTLAHEARHRGFRILWDTPEIMSKIPQPLRDTMGIHIKDDTGKLRDSYEHLMIYAVSMPPTEGNVIGPDRFFRSKEEYYKYRRDYKIAEQAAKSYVMNMKVTPGGLAALRNEVDKMTPKDEVIKIVPGPTGAVAVGTTPVKTAAPAAVKVAEPAAAAVQPANVTAPDATTAATPKTYSVQRGDTLGRISQKYYKGRLSDLLRANPQFTANGRNPKLIFPGDRVIIPG